MLNWHKGAVADCYFVYSVVRKCILIEVGELQSKAVGHCIVRSPVDGGVMRLNRGRCWGLVGVVEAVPTLQRGVVTLFADLTNRAGILVACEGGVCAPTAKASPATIPPRCPPGVLRESLLPRLGLRSLFFWDEFEDE